MKRALEDAADGDAAEIIRVVEVGDENLERAALVAGGLRNGFDDSLKERLKALAGLGRVECRRALLGYRVENRKVELILGRVEIDEKIVNFVQNFLRARIGTVDLVDTNNGRQLCFERL